MSKFSQNSKKAKWIKDKNVYEVLDKFYFEFDKTLKTICEILKQILERLKFL